MAVLGELEQAVMDVLWFARQPLSVREVHDQITSQRTLAYTTVMTVLDRLSKKKIVRRTLSDRAWLYEPQRSRADLVADEIVSLLASGTEDQRRDAWTALLRRYDPASGVIDPIAG